MAHITRTSAAYAKGDAALEEEWLCYEGFDAPDPSCREFDQCSFCAQSIEHTVAEHRSDVTEARKRECRREDGLYRQAKVCYDTEGYYDER